MVEEGFEVDAVDNPITAIEYLAKEDYDLIISDLRMKEMDGLRLASSAKNIQPSIITIILTGEPDEETEIKSLSDQIDLYIIKEKSMNVILEYIRTVLAKEKKQKSASMILRSNNYGVVMNIREHKVYKDDIEITLTPKEFELLRFLLENQNRIVNRDEIIEYIWGVEATDIEERVVDVHMKNLRDKLGVFSISTIRGYGYKWND
jgi:Response regulators consisting of a CheY-like receiver domain and a winged-helix DNA-binding domain